MSTDILGMSDEDFLKIPSGNLPKEEEDNTGNPPVPQEEPKDPPVEEPVEEPVDEPVEDPKEPEEPVEDEPTDDEPKEPAVPGSKTEPKVEEPKEEPKTETPVTAPDYKAFYEAVIGKPIKANGKEIVLQTPEEVTRMIQMGAGFGRKLQEIQPHLKTLRMLEKNNLLDEAKLSYLIDIQSGNPDAIKKLIKDSGINPLDLDNEDNVTYTPHNHSVSDAEMAFHTALNDLTGSDAGKETVQIINRDWDQASKNILWDQPELLGIIQEQRESGIYSQITAEMDRQKLLGKIPPSMPFLQAYKAAGDHLTATNGFKGVQETPPVVQPEPKVIATRVAAPKAPVTNSDKAQAASSPRTTPRKTAPLTNPLEMADDEFLKQFQGRL